MKKLVLVTRKSPLALAQAGLVSERLRSAAGLESELLKVVTTGDRRKSWSLEASGGKGLFTAELEESLLRGEADLAVHSAKDLPGEMTGGLEIAGYLPRADPRDVLVLRTGVREPATAATDSPRRRQQLAARFPKIGFAGIRGNVDTRLKKIAEGAADATVLAAAGIARLGISGWAGLEFLPLGFGDMVPAVGQAAIAVQCRAGEGVRFSGLFDTQTGRDVALERALQAALGGGCHTALGAHVDGDVLWFFHEKTGIRRISLLPRDLDAPSATAARILKELGIP